MTTLHPLNPSTHRAYVDAEDRLLRIEGVPELLARRGTADEEEIDAIDAEIVARTYWYALRPDEIARAVLRYHRWRSPLTIEQAMIVVAALGEAGYPIAGNGAPDYVDPRRHPPTRGPERDHVIWAAARHWAAAASWHISYVSFGDCRGYLPRPVQYDSPGGMHPGQRAALTLGPAAECCSHEHMRRHTRKLILVRGGDGEIGRAP